MCRYDKLVPADELDPHPRNYRKHPAAKIKRLRKTIIKNGWRRPIVVSKLSGKIVKGHAAWTGALHSDGGPDDVPVEYQDYPDAKAEEADLVADNKASDGSDDDDATLLSIIEEAGGMDADPETLGMSADEFGEIMAWLSPDRPKRKARGQKLSYTLDFDDGPQREAFAAFMNRLKAEMGEGVTSVGARLTLMIEKYESK